MNFIESERMKFIPSYAFDEIRRKVFDLRTNGVDVIDMGVGDPVRPTPETVRKACCDGVEIYANSGYPPYAGTDEMRKSAKDWMKMKFGVNVNCESEIVVTLGSKEAIFHLPFGIINDGDCVLIPSPGYPPYLTGTIFAGGRPLFYPLLKENDFLPDLDAISRILRKPPYGGKIRMMWVCYPNAPTGKVAGKEFYSQLIALLQKYDVILASDEAYADFVYEGEFASPLQISTEGVISFYSLSKKSNMTGYRVGWAAGDSRLISILLKVKKNLDSGTPWFIQHAAVKALEDDVTTEKMRKEYRMMRDQLVEALVSAGLEECKPQGALYIWQKTPEGMNAMEFAEKLLAPEIAVVCIPGNMISVETSNGVNPGYGYVRFSLTCLPERVELACSRIKKFLNIRREE